MRAFKDAVTVLKIAPADSWALSISDFYTLFDAKIQAQQDNSLIVNTIRKSNGMPLDKMRNLINE